MAEQSSTLWSIARETRVRKMGLDVKNEPQSHRAHREENSHQEKRRVSDHIVVVRPTSLLRFTKVSSPCSLCLCGSFLYALCFLEEQLAVNLTSIPQLARNANRLREVVQVLSKYGLADWLSRLDWS